MTLDNLKYALILNNSLLYERLKPFLHTHPNFLALNRLSVPEEPPTELYCYKKTIATSSPSARIAYYGTNANFVPAKMNFSTKIFDYGNWKNAFFMKIKPVMLNFDGTVAYELDPDDYTKKIDGTASDVANVDFLGNAMIGIPTIWFKRETVNGIESVYIANKKIDYSYKAYAHTDENGNIMKYTYIPIYDGFIDSNGRLRSISGVTPTCSTTMAQEITAAELNNMSGKHMWNIETRADVQMLIDLCILIGKTSNTKGTFGNGSINENASTIKITGTMNNKGLFYGTNADSTTGVKVFGIEHFWGNTWKRVAGSVYVNNIMKVKMTYGMQDGSAVVGYNQDGTGYVTINNSQITGVTGGGISKTFNNEYGVFVKEANGTSDTYDCDPCYFFDGNIKPQTHGGHDGANCLAINTYASAPVWFNGSALSCKPNVAENILIPAP